MKHNLVTNVCQLAMSSLMGVRRVAKAGVTHPFGDARTVQQAFPAGISEQEADPFLMCDYFNSVEKNGPVSHPDEFPVDWHPHRGFDIASYLKSGVGRHGDSLGNRETYATPGMQWMNTGSGVVHAEGGATAKGVRMQGFQIWINVPKENKMDKPDYGTVTPDLLPKLSVGDGGVTESRVLAGAMFDQTGPFRTKQDVQMVDLELESGSTIETSIADGLDTALLYVYEGGLSDANGQEAKKQSVVVLDASDDAARGIKLTGGEEKSGVLLFAGKKLKQPIAWRGPIVMNTQEQIMDTFRELRSGIFPPVRVDWNYKQIAAEPTK